MEYHSFKVSATTFEVSTRYTFVKPIGSGAYGVVIAAQDSVTGKRVAIKKVQRAFENLTDAKRILREIKLLRMFRHDNIIRIADLSAPPTQNSPETLTDLYLVMDLMDTDLYRIIYSKQELSLDHCQYFLYQILRALKCMHSASVVHRDLKPSNLLLNSNCDLKICDLGLARGILSADAEDMGEQQELTEYVVTRWYRAPEIMLACDSYSTAIDVWSVGCIFSELLERRPLFPGDDYIDQLRRIVSFVGKPSQRELDSFVTSTKAKSFIMGLPSSPKVDFRKRYRGVNDFGLDLLGRMLAFNPAERISVEDALAHPYLSSLHMPDDEPEAGFTFDWSYEQGQVALTRQTLQHLVFDEITLFHPEMAGGGDGRGGGRGGGDAKATPGGGRSTTDGGGGPSSAGKGGKPQTPLSLDAMALDGGPSSFRVEGAKAESKDGGGGGGGVVAEAKGAKAASSTEDK